MISDVEALLQQVLEQHNYNTVGNFIQFYKSFKATNCTRLADYFQHYLPPITAAHHSCVGLALELRRNIEKHAGPIASYFYIVSCEESIGAFEEYPCLYKSLYETRDILEKEHVLLALRFMLQGRAGILLLDPGYHVARAIVVMKDNLYPHTGWFTQSKEPHLKKQYNYSFSNINDDFVQWSERVSRNKNCVQEAHSVIYIRKPYLTSVDVTERRNLVYSFRSWLSRDGKGHLIAGVYFKIAEADDQFTLFYHDSDSKLRIKLNFSQFAQPQMINDQLYTLIEKCNDQLHLSPGQLLLSFEMMNNIMKDKAYLQQLLDINNAINIMTES